MAFPQGLFEIKSILSGTAQTAKTNNQEFPSTVKIIHVLMKECYIKLFIFFYGAFSFANVNGSPQFRLKFCCLCLKKTKLYSSYSYLSLCTLSGQKPNLHWLFFALHRNWTSVLQVELRIWIFWCHKTSEIERENMQMNALCMDATQYAKY